MNSYDTYLYKLNAYSSDEEQQDAIHFLSNASDWDYSNCIRKTGKDTWENLLTVIENRNKRDQVKLAKELLFLFMDLNWPGARRAHDLLKTFSKEEIKPALEETLLLAFNKNDTDWIYFLKYLILDFNFVEDDFDKINLKRILDLADDMD